ncbi:MAG: DHH family phosphoesterase, partial [Omnitrophica bacterium]|nr:DHH family phosphoesterase [Candidatus Omnitrophota bacterium]
MNRIWRIKEPHHTLGRSLTETLRISPIMAQLLINRGITDEMQAHHFLYGDITSCHDPSLFTDMEKSVLRIKHAAKNKENILLYGDYDVDGITGVALLSRTLNFLGIKHATHIPNRLEEGYGLNSNAVKSAHAKKTALIITVDCGISGNREVDLANSLGIDVIITDHHEIKNSTLPKAYTIINPLQEKCRYPFKYLSGVGLAYKLAQVLLRGTSFPVEEHLDLVALGTVSDLSAQHGENRILTRCGLRKLKETKKVGIKALIDVCRLKEKAISSRHIGFILGPRINAMGRIGSPEVALKLLLTDDRDEAATLAGIMDKANRNRQKIERGVLEEAMEAVKREVNFKESRVIVLSKAG